MQARCASTACAAQWPQKIPMQQQFECLLFRTPPQARTFQLVQPRVKLSAAALGLPAACVLKQHGMVMPVLPAFLTDCKADALSGASSATSSSSATVRLPHPLQTHSRRGTEHPTSARADVHILGEVAGATGFKSRQPAISCKWRLVFDASKSWAVVRGLQVGRASWLHTGRLLAVPPRHGTNGTLMAAPSPTARPVAGSHVSPKVAALDVSRACDVYGCLMRWLHVVPCAVALLQRAPSAPALRTNLFRCACRVRRVQRVRL